MSQAKKYFVDSKKNYSGQKPGEEAIGGKEAANNKNGSGDELIDKVIDGVKKNIGEAYFPKRKDSQEYKAPLPEKVTAGADDDLDGLVNSPVGSIKGKKVSGAGNPMKNSSNPLEYIAGEVLQNVRDSVVKSPLDATYQIARKLGRKVVAEPVSGIDTIMHEAMILGIYAFIEGLLKKKQP